MAQDKDKKYRTEGMSLERLVIEHNAEARITYQLAQQLESHLPISSFDKLSASIRELVVDDQRIPLKIFEPVITKELFPIDSAEQLVEKMSAAVRLAFGQAERGGGGAGTTHESLRALLGTSLVGGPGRKAAIPAGYFVGPSLYGSTLAKGGK